MLPGRRRRWARLEPPCKFLARGAAIAAGRSVLEHGGAVSQTGQYRHVHHAVLALAAGWFDGSGVALILQGQPSLHKLLGSLLSFIAVVMFALETVGIKLYPQADMVKVTCMGAFLGALMVLPFASFSHTSGQDLAWLWLYGFLNIGVGFGLFLLGVQRVKAVLANLAWSAWRRPQAASKL